MAITRHKISGRSILWVDSAGTTHSCARGEGIEPPELFLVWTDCGKDVPAKILEARLAKLVTCSGVPFFRRRAVGPDFCIGELYHSGTT